MNSCTSTASDAFHYPTELLIYGFMSQLAVIQKLTFSDFLRHDALAVDALNTLKISESEGEGERKTTTATCTSGGFNGEVHLETREAFL